MRRYRHKSGSIVWGQASVTLVRDPDGRPSYLMGVMADITERKRTEEALRESEERFRTLAEAIPQLVWTCRPDGYCDYFNTQWADYTGISVTDSIGHCWSQVLHPEDLQATVLQWKKALASGAGFDAETRLRGRNGTYRWFKTRALPLHNEKGEILRWFGTCTDISDIVKAREALARSREDLEVLIRKRTASLREAVADLEHFSYSITHDMRGPLRAMQSFAILLQRESGDRLPPRSLDFLHRIIDRGGPARQTHPGLAELQQNCPAEAAIARRRFGRTVTRYRQILFKSSTSECPIGDRLFPPGRPRQRVRLDPMLRELAR